MKVVANSGFFYIYLKFNKIKQNKITQNFHLPISKQVVDARIGPGIKSMTKFKKRKEEQLLMQNGSTEFAGQANSNAQNIRNNTMPERFGKIFKKIQKKKTIITRSCDENSQPTSSSGSDNDDNETRLSDDASDRLECDEDMSSMKDEYVAIHRNSRKQTRPIKNRSQTLINGTHIIDPRFWKQRKTCCGYFYESSKFAAILVELDQYSVNTCSVHAKKVPSVCEVKEDLIKLPSVIKSLPLKKQHFLRQCMIEAAPIVEPMEQSAPIDYSKATTSNASIPTPDTTQDARVSSNLHKIKADSGKVAKKAPKKKLSDLSGVKNLVKLCTSSKIANAAAAECNASNGNQNGQKQTIEHNENENIVNTNKTEPIAVNKYSDNSSDSGYEETLHDTTQLKQIAKIGTTRPVILSNGVKLHVKPENLLLAANLAGVSQTAIQTTQVNFIHLNVLHFLAFEFCA